MPTPWATTAATITEGEALAAAAAQGEGTAAGGGAGGMGPNGDTATDDKPAYPSSRFITIAIVSATLAAALVGFLFNHASAASQQASGQAQDLNLQASTLQTSTYQIAEDNYFNYLTKQSDLAKATQAFFESTLPDDPNPQQWASLQKITDQLTVQAGSSLPKDMHPKETNGPNPNFPDSFFATRTERATELSSLANGYNDIGGQWGKLGSSYSAILTLLAISLFLFGSSLALYGSSRLLFVRLGIVLVIVACAWTAVRVIDEPGAVSNVAAVQYAKGVTLLANTTTPDSYRPALEAFSTAIRNRPDYAQAYDERAETEDNIGSEGPYSDDINVVSRQWLQMAVQDEEAAYSLGLRDEDELTDLGRDAFDLWVTQGGGTTGFPPEALAADQELTRLDSTNPVGWTELGLAEILNGQAQQARSDFRLAIENILYSNVASKAPRPAHSFNDQQDWIQNAITQLNELVSSTTIKDKPTVNLAAMNEEGFIAASIAAGRVTQPSSLRAGFRPDSVDFYLLPNALTVNITPSNNWDPTKGGRDIINGNVMTVWYSRPLVHGKGTGPWSAISDSVDWGSGSKNGPLDDPNTCGADDYCQTTNFLSDVNQCFSNAQYRVDVFYNGEQIISKAAAPTTDFGNPIAREDQQMNIGTCIPPSWQYQTSLRATSTIAGTQTPTSHSLGGILMSYTAPGNKYGYDMLRIYPDRGAFSGNLTSFSESVIQYAVGLFAGDTLPSDLTEGNPLTDQGFMNLDDNVEIPYESSSSKVGVLAGAGITSDKAVIVAVEYGPSNWFASNEAVNLFSSASLLSYG